MKNELDPKTEVDALHAAIYELYRGKSTDLLQIKRLWHRIDVLEAQIDSEVSK